MFVPGVRLTTRQIQIGISGYDLQLFTLNFLKPFLTWTPTLSYSHTITTLYLSLSPSLADTIPLSHTHSTSLSVNPTAANLRESYSSQVGRYLSQHLTQNLTLCAFFMETVKPCFYQTYEWKENRQSNTSKQVGRQVGRQVCRQVGRQVDR